MNIHTFLLIIVIRLHLYQRSTIRIKEKREASTKQMEIEEKELENKSNSFEEWISCDLLAVAPPSILFSRFLISIFGFISNSTLDQFCKSSWSKRSDLRTHFYAWRFLWIIVIGTQRTIDTHQLQSHFSCKHKGGRNRKPLTKQSWMYHFLALQYLLIQRTKCCLLNRSYSSTTNKIYRNECVWWRMGTYMVTHISSMLFHFRCNCGCNDLQKVPSRMQDADDNHTVLWWAVDCRLSTVDPPTNLIHFFSTPPPPSFEKRKKGALFVKIGTAPKILLPWSENFIFCAQNLSGELWSGCKLVQVSVIYSNKEEIG